MTPINTLRKECERVRALAVTKQLVGEARLAALLDTVVDNLSLSVDTLNIEHVEVLSDIVGEIADITQDKDVQFAYREWYRSLVHIGLSMAKENGHVPA